jgi:hypothetical protein
MTLHGTRAAKGERKLIVEFARNGKQPGASGRNVHDEALARVPAEAVDDIAFVLEVAALVSTLLSQNSPSEASCRTQAAGRTVVPRRIEPEGEAVKVRFIRDPKSPRWRNRSFMSCRRLPTRHPVRHGPPFTTASGSNP